MCESVGYTSARPIKLKADGSGEVSTHSTPTQGSPTFSRTTLGAAYLLAKISRNL